MTPPINADPFSWAKLILACAVVCALLAGLGFVLKFVKQRGLRLPGIAANQSRRLEIVESMPLDLRRRLVIVRCDEDEHLLLLGQEQDIVVETHLNKPLPSLRTKSGT